MNRITAGLAAAFFVAASGLLASAAMAQSRDSAPIGCSGDYVCGDDPSAVMTWPLERWTEVRKAPRRVTSNTAGPVRRDATATR